MEIKLNVPMYNPEDGIVYEWESGFTIEVKVVDSEVTIIANREGLISLANHLLNLAQKEVPSGHHLHFDESNSLEKDSCDLIIEKRN